MHVDKEQAVIPHSYPTTLAATECPNVAGALGKAYAIASLDLSNNGHYVGIGMYVHLPCGVLGLQRRHVAA